jgi:hypothetical protein
MMAMRAVPISERFTPPPQAGVKCSQLPLPPENARSTSNIRAPYFAIVARFMTTAARLTPR